MRNETALARLMKAQIRDTGPLTVSEFMDLALNHPEHGYYRTRAAIGADGDFITAPEISQIFGEIVGLWCAVVWQSMGSPARVRLIELGPGRGTLMADALRAARRVPAFAAALDVHLVESNRALTAVQQDKLQSSPEPITWHDAVESVRDAGDTAPAIVIANEFLDTCAARQITRVTEGWVERGIALDAEGELAFTDDAGRGLLPVDAGPSGAVPGDVFEIQDFAFVERLGNLLAGRSVAALFFDYGHPHSAAGDTLQALKRHAAEHPLASPGEADLTVHVDFEAFAAAASASGFAVDGPVPQGEFLGRLGIIERASRLMAANPTKASEIELQVGRILSPNGMGSRFKAIGLRAGLDQPLPGF